MPYIGDYLGQLLSEISVARMQADLETVRLAELYASHRLLRSMPVPHVRLPEVELDIPVLIKESAEPRAGESARGSARPEMLRQKFGEVLEKHLAKAGISLSPPELKSLRAALDAQLGSARAPREINVDVHRVADELTETAVRFVRKGRGSADTKPLPFDAAETSALREQVRLEFLKLRPEPPRLMVMVTSAELREAGSPENLTRLRLKVSEQSVEWTTIESGGVQSERLVPE